MRASEDVVEIRHAQILKFDNGEGPFFDDLSKQQLPTALVKAAPKKELNYFEMKSVWKRVPVQDAWKIVAIRRSRSGGSMSTKATTRCQTFDDAWWRDRSGAAMRI